MKKGLSVLLIIAALFGFYGGATNLNDVLACKDYWEKEGERSTADMNKLEDGLNQLLDNEEAYLDGLDQVKEGEEKLADGEATLAQGEADYAAAPAKLADARRQLAEGQDELDEGAAKLKKLSAAIAGVNKILNGYNNTWRPGYETLKDGRSKLYNGAKGSKGDLTSLAKFLTSGQSAYLDAVEDVAGDDERQSAKDYKDFIKSTNQLAKDLPKIQENVANMTNLAKGLHAGMNAANNNFEFAKFVSENKSKLKMLVPLMAQKSEELAAQFSKGVDDVAAAYENFDTYVEKQGWPLFFAREQGKAAISQAKQGIALTTWQKQYKKEGQPETDQEKKEYAEILAQVTDDQAKAYIKKNSADAKAAVEAGVKANYDNNEDLNAGKPQLIGGVKQVVDTLEPINEKVNGDNSALKNTLLPGLKQFNAAATEDKIDQLADGQNTMADGLRTISSGVLNNKTLKAGVKKKMGNSALTLLKVYKQSPNPANTKMSNFAAFEKQMDKTPGLVTLLMKARKFLGDTRADGLKTYNAGQKKLANGKAQYAQGLADYEAAPAKLADGRKQLADGREELAAGKEKLAEYEDGEGQVRDGLATLMSTEANGGLESILDRRNGDDEFDDANGHLGLKEGLEAVGVGRGYQADSGVLITKEITARAVGTAAGLVAAVLAVLAGLLSLLKKNKGAAVSAILAAVAAGAGAGYGMNAGTEFSDIAGSTVGNTAWIAFGVLAAIAIVHALVHFTAKKDA